MVSNPKLSFLSISLLLSWSGCIPPHQCIVQMVLFVLLIYILSLLLPTEHVSHHACWKLLSMWLINQRYSVLTFGVIFRAHNFGGGWVGAPRKLRGFFFNEQEPILRKSFDNDKIVSKKKGVSAYKVHILVNRCTNSIQFNPIALKSSSPRCWWRWVVR